MKTLIIRERFMKSSFVFYSMSSNKFSCLYGADVTLVVLSSFQYDMIVRQKMAVFVK